MTSTPAIALLRDGTRIPLSDPWEDARRHWRDGEYDSDVVAIEEATERSEGPAPALPMHPQIFTQECLPL